MWEEVYAAVVPERCDRVIGGLVFKGPFGNLCQCSGVNPPKGPDGVRSSLINRLVALGFIAAAVATVLCSAISPQHPVGAGSIWARAIAYVTLVFGAGAIATYLMVLVGGGDRTVRSREIALRVATSALWLPPLLMFYGQSSWFALVLFIGFVVESSRLMAFLKGRLREPGLAPAETQVEVLPFSILKPDFPCGTSMLAAFMMQGAIFAGVAGRTVLAGVFYLAGAAAIAHRSFQMFREFSEAGRWNPARRTWLALVSATLLIVFAWLPYMAMVSGVSGGSLPGGEGANLEVRGSRSVTRNRQPRTDSASSAPDWLQSLLHPERSESHGDSFEVAKQLFESSLPKSPEGKNAYPNRSNKTNIRITEPITGPIFPAVELYPDEHHVTRLVAPPAVPGSERVTGNADPFSIPFDGVYWFWHGPSDHPPLNSVVLHGSPSAHFFRSTDGDLMSMEARQNLGFAVDPRRYGAIEIEIQNADPFPDSVSLVLKIRNTAIAGEPSQNLGLEKVPVPEFSRENGATHQILRFHIPSRLAMGRFDELTVSYFLKGDRSNRSARIAIERFRFVPRGG